LPPVFPSGDDLQQVVWQLVVNAEEAMAHGGGTTLTLRTAARRGEGTVVFEVEDDGPGIPDHVSDRVFEPFYSTKREGEHKGLGLSIAFGIVVAHGGTLELVPTDRGACFRVTLPAADAP
jgi:signal transduction histidine kinase